MRRRRGRQPGATTGAGSAHVRGREPRVDGHDGDGQARERPRQARLFASPWPRPTNRAPRADRAPELVQRLRAVRPTRRRDAFRASGPSGAAGRVFPQKPGRRARPGRRCSSSIVADLTPLPVLPLIGATALALLLLCSAALAAGRRAHTPGGGGRETRYPEGADAPSAPSRQIATRRSDSTCNSRPRRLSILARSFRGESVRLRCCGQAWCAQFTGRKI